MANFPEWVTVAEARARYGDDIEDITDADLRRELDNMTAALEDMLGHGFGRAAIISSTAADNVEVTAAALIVGGDTYTLADYDTLLELEVAVNAGGGDYQMELLGGVRPDMPTSFLRVLAATPCGPTYDLRQILSVSHTYHKATGGESHIFLPLPLYSVNSVTETGTVLATTAYWAPVGKPYVIKKYCSCVSDECQHPRGRWKQTYPDNVIIIYRPVYWLRIPASFAAAVLHAFGIARDIGGYTSESFLSYSYSRKGQGEMTWQQAFSMAGLERYQVKATF
jgi:hypothetical protein